MLSSQQGSFHQGNTTLFPTSAGKQCTCNALMSVIYSSWKSPAMWTCSNLDHILLCGNSLYEQLHAICQQNYLLLSELPSELYIGPHNVNMTFNESYFGFLNIEESSPETGCYTLIDAITRTLTTSMSLLYTIGDPSCGTTSSLIKHSNLIWIFDSHSRNGIGMPISDGRSVILCFPDIRSACDFIIHQGISTNTQLVNIPFDLMGVSVDAIPQQTFINTDFVVANISLQPPSSDSFDIQDRTYFPSSEIEQQSDVLRERNTQDSLSTSRRNETYVQVNNNYSQYGTPATYEQTISSQVRAKASDMIGKDPSKSNLHDVEEQQLPLASERSQYSTTSPPKQTSPTQYGRPKQGDKKTLSFALKECQTIAEFHSIIKTGPIYVCCCCLRFLYRHTVVLLAENKYKNPHILRQCCLPVSNPQTSRWICQTCHRALLKGIMPVMSYGNNMALSSIPEILSILSGLEMQLISLIVPFMKIVAKPRGGQHGIKGPVILVPADLTKITSLLPPPGGFDNSTPFTSVLPRPTSEAQIITLALKRRLSDIYSITKQYIRPESVNNALMYLIQNNFLYSNVTFNPNWIDKSVTESYFITDNTSNKEPKEDISSQLSPTSNNSTQEQEEKIDSEDEVDNDNPETVKQTLQQKASINNATTLHPIDGPQVQGNIIYNLAPGEGQRPISVFSELHWEAMAFPTLFPNGTGTFKDRRSVPISAKKYVRARIMSSDPRFAQSTPYIFLSLHWLEQIDVNNSIQFQLKKRFQGDLNAGHLKNPTGIAQLVSADQMYATFKKVRGTPQYWKQLQLDMLAKLRQMGNYSFFLTASSAEFHWPEIIMIVAKQYGEDLTEEQVAAMNWETKRQYLQRNPVTVARHIDFIFSKLWGKVILGGLHPIGQILNYDRRLEMQSRGTAHFHSAIHVQNAPIVDKAADEEIIRFINKYIRCDIPNATNDPTLFELVNSLQRHHHTKTCKKKKGVSCRFHYPKPPASQTTIARQVTDEESSSLQEKSRAIMKQVYEELLKYDTNSAPTLPNLLNSLSISPAQYESALEISTGKTTIIYKRETTDIYINNYNATILKALRSNMDIQFITNIWACIAYLTSYMCKPERSMSELMRKACKEADSSNVRDQLKDIGQVFLKSREVSEHEAIYRIISTPLRKSNISVTFIDTNYFKDRARMLKSMMNIKGMADENTKIFATNIHEKYAARPYDLCSVCLAFFGTNYTARQQEESNEDITEADEIRSDEKTSRTIKLLHNMGTMRKRRQPTVLRYNFVSKDQDREHYFYRLLLLYLPWRDEKELLHSDGTYETKFKQVATNIERTIKEYEPHSEAVEDILENFDPEETTHHIWDQMAAEVEKDILSEQQIPYDEPFSGLNPDLVEQTEPDLLSTRNRPRKVPFSTTTEAKLLADFQYFSLIRSLNSKQKLLHNFIYQWCIEYKLASITKNKPIPFFIFLSGGGGVGKSHLINAIYQSTIRALREKPLPSRGIPGTDPSKPVILLTATTGKAASNIDGTTLHSAFALPIKEKGSYLTYKPPKHETLNSMRVELSNLRVLVIDEVSMLKSQDLHHLHLTMQLIFGNQLPFGGICVLAVGDLMQLNPVAGSPVFEKAGFQYATLAPNVWKDNFKLYELTEIVRQKDDPQFALLLSRLRVNKCTEIDYQTLESLQNNNVPTNAVHLYMTNAQVMQHNEEMLAEIPDTEKITIYAKDSSKDLPTQTSSIKILDTNPHQTGGLLSVLTVAVGAKFILTKNIDIADGLVNGASGTIAYLAIHSANPLDGYIFVKFDNPNTGRSTRNQYLMKYRTLPKEARDATPIKSVTARFNLSSQASVLVQRKQFPGTLAWALTTHKSQGSTYQYFVADMTKPPKQKSAPQGLIYTMLSRAKNSQGIKIINFDRSLIKVNEKASKEMERLQQHNQCALPSILPSEETSTFPHVGVLNIRSYNSHSTDLFLDEAMLVLHAICLTETRLKVDTMTIMTTKDKHFLICTPSRHGTAILVHNNCTYQVLDLSSIQLQCTGILLSQGDKHIVLISLYVPPKSNAATLSNTLKKLLKITPHKQFPTIICGDFNQPSLGSQHVLDVFFTNSNFSQFVTEPTHNDGGILDRIYSNIALCSPSHWPRYYSDHQLLTIHPL